MNVWYIFDSYFFPPHLESDVVIDFPQKKTPRTWSPGIPEVSSGSPAWLLVAPDWVSPKRGWSPWPAANQVGRIGRFVWVGESFSLVATRHGVPLEKDALTSKWEKMGKNLPQSFGVKITVHLSCHHGLVFFFGRFLILIIVPFMGRRVYVPIQEWLQIYVVNASINKSSPMDPLGVLLWWKCAGPV